ncbi:transcriptional regulator [Kordiimonas sediminis]|uniref:Transcriptional regulator n=1 Tax=Kordiimonas sediminis TaxID=1735581 RepID=A0A919E793_9PROT|nr:metalloregulator ArsR/SmtB family transcription factor [Kordiimonas sediminis]GHF20379.1 transcriptional regulator [Kordiimonas sediminis]
MDPLSDTFHALADPTRRAILLSLKHGEKSAGDIAKPFAISAPAISRHLKVMEKAGLIDRRRDGQILYCQLRADRLKEATEWLERYAQFWQSSFGRLDRILSTEHPRTDK